VPVVYREFRRRAGAYLRRERPDHTLQPTALVHEAYMRLMGLQRVTWQNRAHFFDIAAQTMWRILIDHAREHQAAKRPGAGVKVMLDDRIGATRPRECELIDLDQALVEFTRIDPGKVRLWSSDMLAACLSKKAVKSCRSHARPSRANGNRPRLALSPDDCRPGPDWPVTAGELKKKGRSAVHSTTCQWRM
jgi:RNA polymerase sigma factor (TIGR02999 family)